MNFQEFYKNTENRLTDSILSLWATGDKEMQDYFKYLLTLTYKYYSHELF